jgi:hypothetical protein
MFVNNMALVEPSNEILKQLQADEHTAWVARVTNSQSIYNNL